MTTTTDILRVKLETTGDGKVKASLAGLERGVANVDDKVKKSNRSLITWQRTLGVISVAAAVALTKKVIDNTAALDEHSRKLGVNVEWLQEMRFAASQARIETNTFDMALQRFTRRAAEAAEGGGEAKDALEKLGIALRDSSGKLRPTEALLDDVAEALSQIEDPAQRVRIAFKLFDSEGVKMVNMLANGRAGMRSVREEARELGLVLDEETVKGAAEADRKLDALSKVLSVQFTKALVSVAPLLTDIGGLLLKGAKAAQEFFDQFDDVDDMSVKALDRYIEGLVQNLEAARENLETVQSNSLKDTMVSWFLPSEESLKKRIEELNGMILNARLKLADALKRGNKPGEGEEGGGGGGLTPDKGALDEAEKELEAYQKRLQATIDDLDPAAAKTRAFEQVMADLDRAVVTGAISWDRYAQLVGLATTDTKAMAEAAREAADEQAEFGRRLGGLLDQLDPARAKTREYMQAVADLDRAMLEGLISFEEHNRLFAELADGSKDSFSLMTEFGMQAARNMQDAFGDLFFDAMKGEIGDLEQSFVDMINRMVAELLASQLLDFLVGDFAKTGSLGGVVGDLAAGFFAGGLPGFATGGSFSVGGAGGTDSQLVAFRATPGERVDVRTPGQQQDRGGGGSPVVVNMTVHATDAGSFRRSQHQITSDLQRQLVRARRIQ